MLQVCICDDDKSFVNRLTPLVYFILEKYPVQVAYLDSGESFLFHFEENPNFVDIVLMDIDMGELNGIETMTQMRQLGFSGELIYLTAMRDYVFDSFDTYPLNYILKTEQNMDKLQSVLLAAAESSMKRRNRFLIVGSNKNATKVEKINITYMEAASRQVLIHLRDNSTVEYSGSLVQTLEMDGMDDFVQIHKSYLVNLHNIRQIKTNSLILTGGSELPLGRKFVTKIRAQFSDFLSRNTIEV